MRPDERKNRLLNEMHDAATPSEIAQSIADARAWLADHPDDDDVVLAMLQLFHVERLVLGV